jgi:hypothetical protein
MFETSAARSRSAYAMQVLCTARTTTPHTHANNIRRDKKLQGRCRRAKQGRGGPVGGELCVEIRGSRIANGLGNSLKISRDNVTRVR